VNLEIRLSPNFTLGELVHSDTAVRLGIDNTPPAEVLPHLEVLAQGLEQIRGILGFPVVVVSGYRCEALERILCWRDFMRWAARRSRDADEAAWADYFASKAHPRGFAGDWVCRRYGPPRACIEEIVRAERVRFDQLIEEGTWAHTSFDPRLRGEILTARFVNGTPTYVEGLA
jgi:putative chitinase